MCMWKEIGNANDILFMVGVIFAASSVLLVLTQILKSWMGCCFALIFVQSCKHIYLSSPQWQLYEGLFSLPVLRICRVVFSDDFLDFTFSDWCSWPSSAHPLQLTRLRCYTAHFWTHFSFFRCRNAMNCRTGYQENQKGKQANRYTCASI